MSINKPSSKLSCILLAAGMSKRMGEVNKLLLEVDGEPLIRRTAMRLLDYGMEEIVVVLGHESEQIEAAIEDLPVKKIVNYSYESGQMTSVHVGLSTLIEKTNGIMIYLSDLLLVTKEDITEIHRAYEQSNAQILVPQFNGQRGNPIIFSPTQRDVILRGEKNLGCRKLISKNPDIVTAYKAKNDHVLCDLDTPESIDVMSARLGSEITSPNELKQTA